MCGIAGIFDFHRAPDLSPLDTMRDAMAHRGPDDAHTVRLADGGMATRRLAIQDPAGGRQPMSDSSGRFWVAMNGEIYNFSSLARECRARGATFRTRCDTEVLAEMVALHGVHGTLPRLHGMFAVAIYDTLERELWLARDRLGQKPLYYGHLPGSSTLLFASELKGILAHPAVPRRILPPALAAYLMFEYVPAPWTIYTGIHKLEPATLLRVGPSGLQRSAWWDPPLPEPGGSGPSAGRRWARALAGAFREAAVERLVSDVPLGLLLSGGLDSTALLATVREKLGPAPPCFTLSQGGSSFDDALPAASAASHFSCRHKVIRFNSYNLPDILAELGRSLDEPLGDSSLPATWWLMRAVSSSGLKVVLSGDGGDESLGGYQTYLAHRLAPAARLVAPILSRLAPLIPTSYGNVTPDYQVKRFVQGLHLPAHRRNQVWLGAILPWELEPGLAEEAWAVVDEAAESLAGLPAHCTAMALDRRFYLGEGVLAKVDRASQAHGVEVRSPFLDHRFVELAARVPSGLKLGIHSTKAIWRRAHHHLLPRELLRMPKKGFGTPVGPWLKGSCTHLLEGLEDRTRDWVDPAAVRRWKEEHLSGAADHRRRLWTLLVLAAWAEGPWGP